MLDEGRRALVVCSALAGVSDALEAAVAAALAGGPPDVVSRLSAVHAGLVDALGVVAPPALGEELERLAVALAEVRLSASVTPRSRAAILSAGERMSTAIGQAWLASRGLDVAARDARELLVGCDDPDPARRYLSASAEAAPGLLELDRDAARVVVTQGFVASDGEAGTVLLGRGGSDTSAAALAALLGAERLEIWTDVAGLYSGDPRRHRGTRRLARLSYLEAEAMATLGAKVLHPRCLAPVREAGIPLRVCSTFRPEADGTWIDGADAAPGVRAVTSRRGLVLVKLSRPARWQPVGFLAEVAACFARRGFSIDLVATSPGEVGATVDPAAAPGMPLEPLLADLSAVGRVEIVRPVASVSLVGTSLRSIPTRLAAALATAAGIPVRLVVHGASDHHVTFVVDEGDERALTARLHGSLSERVGSSANGAPSASLGVAS